MTTSALVLREDGAPATLDWLREGVLANVISPRSKCNYAKAFEELGNFLAAASQPLSGELARLPGHLLDEDFLLDD